MSNKISFISEFAGTIPNPKPAKFYLPKEYKEFPTEVELTYRDILKTYKKCMPFLDAYTSGYVIPFSFDTLVLGSVEKQEITFNPPADLPKSFTEKFRVSYHPHEQFPNSIFPSNATVKNVFKFFNPWIIKTPPGYSCLFTQPFNKPSPFKIVDAIVDTDQFEFPINFPFFWTTPFDKKVMLKKDSPQILVIPFKRESWKIDIQKEKPKQQEKRKENFIRFFSDYMDNYRKKIWHKKDFS